MRVKKRSLVFLIHGFMGHPQEFGPLVNFLESQGVDTHRVCLPHHGNQPGNIADVTWEDMLDACQQDLEHQKRHYDTIHLLGFSLGGALSLLLNQDNPDVFQSVTLVAAPYKEVFNWEFGHYHLKNFFNRFIPGTQYWYQAETGFPKPYLLPMDMLHFYHHMLPFFRYVREAAYDLTAPTLLIHSPYDLTVPYEHSEWLYQAIPGETNFLTVLNCGHQVFPYNVRGLVEEAIWTHMQTAQEKMRTSSTA
jgi:esterase/lipase